MDILLKKGTATFIATFPSKSMDITQILLEEFGRSPSEQKVNKKLNSDSLFLFDAWNHVWYQRQKSEFR